MPTTVLGMTQKKMNNLVSSSLTVPALLGFLENEQWEENRSLIQKGEQSQELTVTWTDPVYFSGPAFLILC